MEPGGSHPPLAKIERFTLGLCYFFFFAAAYLDRMSTPAPSQPTLTWRAHAVALFVTAHLACVFLYALPRPPVLNQAVLEHPEVKTELEQSFGTLHNLLPWRESPQAMQDDVLGAVRAYTRTTDAVRRVIAPYLELAGSTQSWHMFGGTPPRFPLVFVVEVQPTDADHYILFQDLNWGTPDSKAMNFRHRKAQELLSIPPPSPQEWNAYAVYWARRWDERHPERPARRVRLFYRRLHTPDPTDVRRGRADRQPEDVLPAYVWERAL